MATPIFDDNLGEQLKFQGMLTAAERRKWELTLARGIAEKIAARRGSRLCNADDVGRVLKREHSIDSLGPATGSLFKHKNWEWTGHWVKSKRVSNHSRMIRQWRLKDGHLA